MDAATALKMASDLAEGAMGTLLASLRDAVQLDDEQALEPARVEVSGPAMAAGSGSSLAE